VLQKRFIEIFSREIASKILKEEARLSIINSLKMRKLQGRFWLFAIVIEWMHRNEIRIIGAQ